MSKADRIQRELQRAARRAKRLTERAEQRAGRRAARARKVASRAEELADRVSRTARRRSQELERNIEDAVDQVADRWSRKAERWIDSASNHLFDGENDHQAKKANTSHKEAEEAGSEMGRSERSYRRRQRRAARSSQRSARTKMRFRTGLYRDPDRKKICGVCAGFADYFGIEVWQMRLGAILGLVFIPQLIFCGYFVAYFLMDKKPYYRRVTDRFDRVKRQAETEYDAEEDRTSVNEDDSRTDRNNQKPRMPSGLALRTAKSKFAELEDRVRSMESHVTSSTFELQRELKKLSGEN